MQFTRGAAVLAAALLTTGLAACGEDEPVEPTSSSTVSPLPGDSTTSSSDSSDPSSSTSSATGSDGPEMPSDLPEAAREETKAGAAAFGKYYFKKFGEAGHTGKTKDLVMLGQSSCPPCKQAVTDIDADAKKGRTRSPNPFRLTNTKAVARPDKGYKVTADVKVKAHHAYENDEIIADVDASQFTLTEHVVWADGRWQVADWVIS